MKNPHAAQPKPFVTKDAERVFDTFFKEHPLKESEKSFFDMSHEHHKGTHFDPYKILGLETGASNEKVNEAYRELAMKYHPKNDPSVEAG